MKKNNVLEIDIKYLDFDLMIEYNSNTSDLKVSALYHEIIDLCVDLPKDCDEKDFLTKFAIGEIIKDYLRYKAVILEDDLYPWEG